MNRFIEGLKLSTAVGASLLTQGVPQTASAVPADAWSKPYQYCDGGVNVSHDRVHYRSQPTIPSEYDGTNLINTNDITRISRTHMSSKVTEYKVKNPVVVDAYDPEDPTSLSPWLRLQTNKGLAYVNISGATAGIVQQDIKCLQTLHETGHPIEKKSNIIVILKSQKR